jgi:hypothetical protein
MTARTARRRPLFGELVIVKGQRFTISRGARPRGIWLRPEGVGDPSRDRFLPGVEWLALEWDPAVGAWRLE